MYDTLRQDSRNGDFVSQTNNDRFCLDINLDDSEIKSFSKGMWKSFVDKKIKKFSFSLFSGRKFDERKHQGCII